MNGISLLSVIAYVPRHVFTDDVRHRKLSKTLCRSEISAERHLFGPQSVVLFL